MLVETAEVIQGIRQSGREFRDVRDAGEYLATHVFSDTQDFSDAQIEQALKYLDAHA